MDTLYTTCIAPNIVTTTTGLCEGNEEGKKGEGDNAKGVTEGLMLLEGTYETKILLGGEVMVSTLGKKLGNGLFIAALGHNDG